MDALLDMSVHSKSHEEAFDFLLCIFEHAAREKWARSSAQLDSVGIIEARDIEGSGIN
jgi:hypothetical protein